MKRRLCGVIGLAALAATLLHTAEATEAAGPAFDCAQAQGRVEQLICADAGLAALDRQLERVYQAATAKAQGSLRAALRAAQRGWVKGRNDCWKADGQPTWITATWTVNTVKACVEAQTRLRTAELQAVWRLLPTTPQAYACQHNPANELVVNAFATDPPTLRLERGDRSVTLWRVGPADAGRYEGQNVDLQQQGSELAVRWLNTDTGQTDELRCQPR